MVDITFNGLAEKTKSQQNESRGVRYGDGREIEKERGGPGLDHETNPAERRSCQG